MGNFSNQINTCQFSFIILKNILYHITSNFGAEVVIKQLTFYIILS